MTIDIEKEPAFQQYRAYYAKDKCALLMQGRNYNISEKFNVNFDNSKKLDYDCIAYSLNNKNSYAKIIRENEHAYEFLEEGLIATYPAKQAIKSALKFLNNKLPNVVVKHEIIEYDINTKIAGLLEFGIEFSNDNKNEVKTTAKEFADYFHVFGYDLSREYIRKTNNAETLKLVFEARYYRKNFKLSDWLYHVTSVDKAKKILEQGFVPKSKNDVFSYKDRLYFFTEQNLAEMTLYIMHQMKDVVLFRLDSKKIQAWKQYKTGKVEFFVDPKYVNGNSVVPTAVYTHDYIPASFIDDKCLKYDFVDGIVTNEHQMKTNELKKAL